MSNNSCFIVTETCSDSGAYGFGKTMEDALSNLEAEVGDIDRDDLTFYECDRIEVEFKIVKKEVVKSIKKVPNV